MRPSCSPRAAPTGSESRSPGTRTILLATSAMIWGVACASPESTLSPIEYERAQAAQAGAPVQVDSTVDVANGTMLAISASATSTDRVSAIDDAITRLAPQLADGGRPMQSLLRSLRGATPTNSAIAQVTNAVDNLARTADAAHAPDVAALRQELELIGLIR